MFWWSGILVTEAEFAICILMAAWVDLRILGCLQTTITLIRKEINQTSWQHGDSSGDQTKYDE
jgi:hypothetical protein